MGEGSGRRDGPRVFSHAFDDGRVKILVTFFSRRTCPSKLKLDTGTHHSTVRAGIEWGVPKVYRRGEKLDKDLGAISDEFAVSERLLAVVQAKRVHCTKIGERSDRKKNGHTDRR